MDKRVYALASISPFCFEKAYIKTDERRKEKLKDLLKNATVWLIFYQVSNWSHEVQALLEKYDEGYFKSCLIDLLNKLKDTRHIVECDKKRLLKNEEEFYRIVKEDPLYDEIRFLLYKNERYGRTLDTLNPEELRVPGAIPLEKQGKEEVEKMLKPLLLFAEKVDIYDKYIDLSIKKLQKQYIPLLEIIETHIGTGCPGARTEKRFVVTIHYSGNIERVDRYESIAKLLSERSGNSFVDYCFVHWKNGTHDRYIKIDQSYLVVGKGAGVIDHHRDSDSTWSRLETEEARNLLKKFDENVNDMLFRIEPPYNVTHPKRKYTIEEMASEMDYSVEKFIEKAKKIRLPFFPDISKNMPPISSKQKEKLIEKIKKSSSQEIE